MRAPRLALSSDGNSCQPNLLHYSSSTGFFNTMKRIDPLLNQCKGSARPNSSLQIRLQQDFKSGQAHLLVPSQNTLHRHY